MIDEYEADPLVGTQVGPYRVLEVLGRGGMGIVYKAEDTALARTVALKRITPERARDDFFLRRFRSEARALARLDSSHITRIHTLCKTDRGLFIVMEYVPGGSLADMLTRGLMSEHAALPLICQMLTALEDAHRAGVIHRDIKPHNILITPEGTVKVTDFGLARMHQRSPQSTLTQGTAGTLNYMSPEQVQGLGELDHRSDLYSMGMTIYEMLAGRLPFEEESSQFAKARAIVEEGFPSPDRYRPGLSEALAAVVTKALEKDPEARFQSAAAMGAAVSAVEVGQEESGGQATEPAKWPLGIRGGVALLLLLVFVLVGGGYSLSLIEWGAYGPRENRSEQSPAAVPPPSFVRSEVRGRLPEGFVTAGDPVLDSAGGESGDLHYRIPLHVEQKSYAVPVVDLRLPDSMPAPLRERSDRLLVHSRLPPGKMYDTEAAQPASRPSLKVEGIWPARFEKARGGWRVVESEPVEISEPSNAPAAKDEVLLTQAELNGAKEEKAAALKAYQTKWVAVERDVERFRSRAMRKVPSGCSKDLEPLVRKVVRLTSECPSLAGRGQREACVSRRDRLNGEIADCRTQNRRRREGLARSRRAVAEYRKRRLNAFWQGLGDH